LSFIFITYNPAINLEISIALFSEIPSEIKRPL